MLLFIFYFLDVKWLHLDHNVEYSFIHRIDCIVEKLSICPSTSN